MANTGLVAAVMRELEERLGPEKYNRYIWMVRRYFHGLGTNQDLKFSILWNFGGEYWTLHHRLLDAILKESGAEIVYLSDYESKEDNVNDETSFASSATPEDMDVEDCSQDNGIERFVLSESGELYPMDYEEEAEVTTHVETKEQDPQEHLDRLYGRFLAKALDHKVQDVNTELPEFACSVVMDHLKNVINDIHDAKHGSSGSEAQSATLSSESTKRTTMRDFLHALKSKPDMIANPDTRFNLMKSASQMIFKKTL